MNKRYLILREDIKHEYTVLLQYTSKVNLNEERLPLERLSGELFEDVGSVADAQQSAVKFRPARSPKLSPRPMGLLM